MILKYQIKKMILKHQISKKRMKRKRTEDWSGKQLHGQFKRETEDLSGVSWSWKKKLLNGRRNKIKRCKSQNRKPGK